MTDRTLSTDRRSVLQALGTGAVGAAGVGGVASAADYDDLYVYIYWAEGSGDFGFSSKPQGRIDEALDALENQMSPQLLFSVHAEERMGLPSPTEWKRSELKDESTSDVESDFDACGGDDTSLSYCDIVSEFKDQLSTYTVIGQGVVNLLIYDSETDDPAKTGAADHVVRQGEEAANCVVGSAPRSLGALPFKNTVVHEVGHTLGADHTDGETYSGTPVRATPMITWYTGSHCDGYQSVGSSCDGDSPSPTCYHTYDLSSCTKSQFNCWMRCEFDDECSC
jgi:hypothetical protein